MSITLRLGSQDLSSYIRLTPGEGFDPYGEGWSEPVFADAPASEGKLLLGTNVNSREMVWPLFLKGVGTAATLGTAYHDAVVADSPVAWWRLAESSGTSAADSAGTFTGTYNNSPTLGAAAADSDTGDKAVTFTAASSQSMTAPLVTSATDNFSLEAWVKLPNLTAQQTDIASNGSSTGPSNGWGIGISNGAETGTGLVLTGLQPGVGNINSGYTFADTNWHHIVMVRESGTTKFYVDGVLQSGTSVAAPLTPTTRFSLATRQFSSTFFNGTIDEVAVYTTALSSTRVSAHYAAASSGGTPAVAGKDNLHALIAQVNNEIANPTSSPLRVEWKDSGASNSTFYDVVAARIDPHFNFRLSEHNLADAALRVWCTPPYGHTATERIIATAAGTGVALPVSITASTILGDIAALGRVTISEGSQPLPRVIAVGQHTSASYVFDFAAPSLTLLTPATLIGASGAAGSQMVQVASYGAGGAWCSLKLPTPSVYAGRNRVLAVMRTGADPGVAVTAHDPYGNRLGATAVASSRAGWQTLDLGVLSVPSAFVGPTSYAVTVRGGAVNAGAEFAPGAVFQAQINRVLVLPEDTTALVVDRDTLTALVADEFDRSGPLIGSFDALGNSWATDSYLGGQVASTSTGTSNGGYITMTSGGGNLAAGTGTYVAAITGPNTLNADVFMRAYTLASQSASSILDVRKGTTRARLGLGTAPYLAIITGYDDPRNIGGGAQTTAGGGLLASVGIAATSMPAGLYRLGLSTRDTTISANLIADNATAALTPAGTTTATSVIAATAVTATGLAPAQVGFGVVTASGFSDAALELRAFWAYKAADTPGTPMAPRDQYVFDAANSRAYRLSGLSGDISADLQGRYRGPKVALKPQTAQVCAVSLPLDQQPTNDLLSVDVRVRERWSYAR